MLGKIIIGFIFKAGEKVADWIPNKKERYRSQIEKIKRKLDEITSKEFTVRSHKQYVALSDKLRRYQEAIKNI